MSCRLSIPVPAVKDHTKRREWLTKTQVRSSGGRFRLLLPIIK